MKLTDLIGQRFGNLVVIERVPSRRTYGGQPVTYWLTLCDCGTKKEVSACNLREGRIQTCGVYGCQYHQAMLSKGAQRGQSGLNQAISLYKTKARRRGIEFSLSTEETSKLFASPCFYCGGAPSNTARRESTYGVFVYNGIDRIDSSRGYVSGNVSACCWRCNCMKNTLTAAEFIFHVNQIIRHHQQRLSTAA